MANDTHEESRPPLLPRWVLLARESQTVQDFLCSGIFAITLQILSGQYLCVPIVVALELGLLAVMDYRDWAKQQVNREASRVYRDVSVSSLLLFSPHGLQDQYHKWILQIPAVRGLPLLSVLTQLAFCARFLMVKAEDECGWIHVAAHLPGTALAAARLALIHSPPEFQSLLSVVSWAYLLGQVCIFTAVNDTCWMSMGHLPDKTALSGYVCFAIATTTAGLAAASCTMHHLDAMLWIAGLGNGSAIYMKYLQNNGGLTFDSDPDFLGFQTVAATMSVCLLVASAIRYWLARKHMTGFLRAIKTHRN